MQTEVYPQGPKDPLDEDDLNNDGLTEKTDTSSYGAYAGSGLLDQMSEAQPSTTQTSAEPFATEFPDNGDRDGKQRSMYALPIDPVQTFKLNVVGETIGPSSDIKQEENDGPRLTLASIESTSSSAAVKVLSLEGPRSADNLLTPPSTISGSINHKIGARPDRVQDLSSLYADYRPRSSIPTRLSWQEHARQGILAAYSSRLSPFALHLKEFELLKAHINRSQVTAYLNIRNAILRLWHRNPLVSVTRQEAAGCARDVNHISLALIAHEWLLRNGYINFGCVDPPPLLKQIVVSGRGRLSRQKTIVVVGAGMSGLGCARHLKQMFLHFEEVFAARKEQPPRIIVLEGRKRVGGRVFSHPLSKQGQLPGGLRSTAELGGQIVVGFDHGNPLNSIIRGQLAIPYHQFRDINSPLYDCDGRLVDKTKDVQVEKLWNDILERASAFRHSTQTLPTVFGNRNLIISGEDEKDDHGASLAALQGQGEEIATSDDIDNAQNASFGLEKVAGRQYQLSKSTDQTAAQAAQDIGWNLRPGIDQSRNIDLSSTPEFMSTRSLGETLDNGIQQYQNLLDLTPQDLRLLNWHHANLEYANAANLNDLSLTGWDQDVGNEFEGYHSVIVGGYTQVPRGLMLLPEPLDVRFDIAVTSIQYKEECFNTHSNKPCMNVKCADGTVFDADQVVVTAPLGVLKQGSISFQPPLPDWKLGAIERMGFGLLNKIVLVYDQCFWDEAKDMFGMLNSPATTGTEQTEYSSCRGRFYLFWNCIKTSGQPVLIALMAGAAANEAEVVDNATLVHEVTQRLAQTFAPRKVPQPREYIVTRWRRDPFARGTYSYVGTQTKPGDYDVMAQPVGPIHFAGEATCGTHPATVHGAYISGLRAASEVLDEIIGPIRVAQEELVPSKRKPSAQQGPPTPKRKAGYVHIWEPINKPDPFYASIKLDDEKDEYEAQVMVAIVAAIGARPIRPLKQKMNPYLLYTKDQWAICKAALDAQVALATGNPEAKASKNDVRTKLGADWRAASTAVKQPYVDKCKDTKDSSQEAMQTYNELAREWDSKAVEYRAAYIRDHPPPVSLENGRKSRKTSGLFSV